MSPKGNGNWEGKTGRNKSAGKDTVWSGKVGIAKDSSNVGEGILRALDTFYVLLLKESFNRLEMSMSVHRSGRDIITECITFLMSGILGAKR